MDLFICNLSAGIMIILTLAMRRIAKYRIPNSVFCLLWGMIGTRLMFPVSVRTPWSVMNVYFHFRNKSILIDYTREETLRTAIMDRIETAGALAERHGNIFTAIWLIGCCVLPAHFIMGYILLWKDVREAEPLEDAEWMKNCIAEQKIRRKVLLKREYGLDTPVTCGIIRPVILIPAEFEAEDRKLSRLVLLHECGHIKYFHALFRLWNVILICLYWYNPIVWIMYFKFERDLEISADRYALCHTAGENKAIYARHLVASVEKMRARKQEPAVYHFYKNNDIKERIEAIMRFEKLGAGAIVATLLIPMGMTTAFATTNNIMDSESTHLTVDERAVPVEEANFIAEESETAVVYVEWEELEPYASFNQERAASYLVIENYKYVTYGRIPPKEIDVTTTVDNHKYAGTLTRVDYIYQNSTDKYTGYYSGRIYLQD